MNYDDIARDIAGGSPSSPSIGDRENPYADIASELARQEDDVAHSALYSSIGQNPDRAARVGVLAKRFSLASETVDADFDEVERRAVLEDRQKAVAYSPRLKKYISIGDNAAVIGDDVEKLARLEASVSKYEAENDFADRMGQRLESGALRLGAAADVTGAVRANTALGVFDAIDRGEAPEDIRRRIYGVGPGVPVPPRGGVDNLALEYFGASADERAELRKSYSGVFSETLKSAATRQARQAAIPANPAAGAAIQEANAGNYGAAWGALKTSPLGVIGQIGFESLPMAAPGLAASMALGPAAGMGLGSFAIEYMNTFSDVLAEAGFDPAKPETVTVLDDPAVMERARQKALARAGIIGAFDAVSGGVAGRGVTSPVAAGAGLARRAASAGGELVAQAGVQAGLGAGGEAAAQMATDGRVQLGDVAAEAFGELVSAPVDVAVAANQTIRSAVGKTSEDAGRAQQAATNQAALDEIVQAANETGLKTRAPDKLKEAIAEQTAGTPVEDVFIPASRLVTYFQEAGIDPTQIEAAVPGILEQIAEAQQFNGDVRVSSADYVTAFAAFHDGLRDDVRIGIDGMTPREAAEYAASSPQELVRAADMAAEEMAADAATGRAGKAIYDDVMRGAVQAGLSAERAQSAAALVRAQFLQLGRETGQDPAALYDRYRLRIQREIPAALLPGRADEMDALIEELRAGKLPTPREIYGASLVEFLAERGGVRDNAGDLKSQDADKWVHPDDKRKKKAERRGLLSDQGAALDDAARAAWEAGYFPEFGDTRPDIDTLVQAIQRELSGKPVYVIERADGAKLARADAAKALEVALDQLGLDAKTATNESIKEALNYGGEKSTVLSEFNQETIDMENVYARRVHGDSPMSRAGYAMFVSGGDNGISSYGKNLYIVNPSSLTESNSVDVKSEAFIQKFKDAANEYGEEFKIAFEHYSSVDDAVELFNPGDIVDTAGAWDDEGAVEFLWEYVLEPNEWLSVITQDGLVTFDREIIRKVESIDEFGEKAVLSQFEQGGKRGSFARMSDGATVITLFEKANASTIYHELGHFFLEVRRDMIREGEASPQMMVDMDALVKWMGVKSMDDIGVEQHEQFARGFEAYLMEGKAPSLELRSAFDAFRRWFLAIYRTIRGLNVAINDEVRGVFDRMLASHEEIQAASRKERYAPLFATAEQAGVTKAEFEAYTKAAEGARISAEDKLFQRALGDLKRQTSKWWASARATMREDVEQEVSSRPVYLALAAMQRGEWPDGMPRPAIKLNRAATVDMIGEGAARLLPRGVTTRTGGVSPDVAAGMMGFRSGIELTDALAGAKPLREVIDAETDARMVETYGDILSDGTLADEAAKVVRNEQRGRALAAELRMLSNLKTRGVASKAAERQVQTEGGQPASEYAARLGDAAEEMAVRLEGGASPEVQDVAALAAMVANEMKAAGAGQRRAEAAASRQTREAVQVDLAALRDAARALISGKSVSDATAFRRYMAAERRAARAVEQAIARRDYDTAATEKRNQLVAHFMAIEAMAAQREVEKAIAKFDRLKKPDSKLAKAIDVDFLNAARGLLTLHGLDFSRFNLQKWADDLLKNEPEKAEYVKAAIEELRAEQPLPYRDMKLEDFRLLVDAVNNVVAVGRNLRSAVIDGRRVRTQTAVDEMVGALAPGKFEDYGKARQATLAEKMQTGLLSIRAALTRVETWARVMDSGEYGAFTRTLIRPIMDALGKYETDRRAYYERLRGIVRPALEGVDGKPVAAPEIGYTFTNKAQLLGALLHTGNEGNMTKLLDGREWTRDGWDAMVNRLAAQGVLTKADFDAVQAIWDLMADLKPGAQQAHKQIYGYRFKEIDTRPLQTPFGEYRGGYMPAKIDPEAAASSRVAGRMSADEIGRVEQQGAMFVSTGRGFTKERTAAAYPLVMDIKAVARHVDDVLRFTHLQGPSQAAARIMNNNKFREAIDSFAPDTVNDMLLPWVNRVATQVLDTPPKTSAGKIVARSLNVIRRNVGLQTIALNIVNAMQQFFAYPSALLVVKPRHMKSGLVVAAKGGGDMVVEKSAFMRERMERGALDALQDIDALLIPGGKLEDARQWMQTHAYFLQHAAQTWVDVPVWIAAYEQALEGGSVEADAVFLADQAIRETQGSARPADISNVEAGSAIARAFLMFYSWFNAQANFLGGRAAVAVKETGWRGGMGRLFWIYTLGLMVPAIGAEILAQGLRGKLEDEDDDGILDEIAVLGLSSQIKFATAMVPGLGSVVTTAINQWNDLPYDDKLSLTPLGGAIESGARAPVSLWNVAMNDGSWSKAIKDLASIIGVATGVPLGQAVKPITYAAEVASEGFSEDAGAYGVLTGLLSGKQQKD